MDKQKLIPKMSQMIHKLAAMNSRPPHYIRHSVQSLGVNSSTCKVEAWWPCNDFWKKKIPTRETGLCPRYAALPVCQKRFWRSEPAFQGTPNSMMQGAMCTGWHMVLGIMWRHTVGLKPGTVNSTTRSGLSYWQIADQLLNLYLLCKICCTGFIPCQHPVHFSYSCKYWHMQVHLGWIWDPKYYTNAICQYISPGRWSWLQTVALKRSVIQIQDVTQGLPQLLKKDKS